MIVRERVKIPGWGCALRLYKPRQKVTFTFCSVAAAFQNSNACAFLHGLHAADWAARCVCCRKVDPKHYYCNCHTNVQRIWWLLMASLTILWRGLYFLKAQNGRGIYLRIRKSRQPIPVNHKLTCLRTGLLSSLSGQRSFQMDEKNLTGAEHCLN